VSVLFVPVKYRVFLGILVHGKDLMKDYSDK